ncbi:unnamed protein product [Haemonchus placei]|uniref:Ectonucleotide pyrophosphatase/phosphodiesterase family member 2 n=1 Tax=Haemonchus placei TaxID=6290 RepID=A0A0N4W9H5_HAEPC|nr:unnamed protein product [Haemonchus placei]
MAVRVPLHIVACCVCGQLPISLDTTSERPLNASSFFWEICLPLPGRSHLGDYWPVFPFQNQFSGGLDLDPSISRHIGGDMNIAVPSWGMLDIYGRFFNRIHDTTTKFGYVNYPVNMLDLEKEDFVKLMSDPSLQYNRNAQPRLPLGKLARTYVPINCKPPMCNPYHANFGFGVIEGAVFLLPIYCFAPFAAVAATTEWDSAVPNGNSTSLVYTDEFSYSITMFIVVLQTPYYM